MSVHEISPQEAAKELLDRRAARGRLGAFCKRIGNVDPVRHQKFLNQKLEDVEDGKIKRLMIFMPPGHAKSTYASNLFPTWYLGKNPTKQIIGAFSPRYQAWCFLQADRQRRPCAPPEVLESEVRGRGGRKD